MRQWVLLSAVGFSRSAAWVPRSAACGGVLDPYALYVVKSNPLLLAACVLCSLPLRKTAVAWFSRRKAAGHRNALRPYLKALLALGLTGLSVLFLVGQSFNPFLYFRF